MSFLTSSAATAQCRLVGVHSGGLTSTVLWDIHTTTGVPSNPRTVDTSPDRPPNAIAFSPAGVLYGVSPGGGGVPASGKLYTIDTVSGNPTWVANLTIYLTVEGDIAFDHTTGILYAVIGTGHLYTINTGNGVCTTVGNLPLDLPGGADYSGLAFDPAGELWVWSTFGTALRHIDKSNAAVLSTVTMSPSPGGSIGAMSFDPATGTAYLGGGTGGGGSTSTVNLTSGAVTIHGPATGMNGVPAIAFDPRECATVTNVGSGCTTTFASFYETLSASGQDLAGTIVNATWNGNGYTITTQPGSGFTVPSNANWLWLNDDDSVAVGTLGFWVGSNGWMASGPGCTNAPVPNVAALLNQPAARVSAWTDLDPSGPATGLVYYDEPSATTGRATYDGVLGKGTWGYNYLQITWDRVSLDWSIEFGALAPTNLQDWLVGYSPAGPNLDPGAADVSTFGAPPHTITATDTQPLTLTALGTPVQTTAATTVLMTTSNIDPAAVLHFGLIGLSNPNLGLSVFGFPNDCYLYAQPAAVIGPTILGNNAPLLWSPITLPAGPVFYSGFTFYCQSMTLDVNATGPGSRASNGLKCKIGLF